MRIYIKNRKIFQETYDVLRAGIKAANNMPTEQNYNYYTCFSTFNDSKNKSVKRILDAMQTIIKVAGGSGKIEHRDIEDKFELVLETNDLLLDRAVSNTILFTSVSKIKHFMHFDISS